MRSPERLQQPSGEAKCFASSHFFPRTLGRQCQSTFWIKIPLWSRYASHWRDLLDDKPVPPERYDEEPDEDEEENEQEENEQEENDVQDHGDASSEMSLDSGVCTLFRVS